MQKSNHHADSTFSEKTDSEHKELGWRERVRIKSPSRTFTSTNKPVGPADTEKKKPLETFCPCGPHGKRASRQEGVPQATRGRQISKTSSKHSRKKNANSWIADGWIADRSEGCAAASCCCAPSVSSRCYTASCFPLHLHQVSACSCFCTPCL